MKGSTYLLAAALLLALLSPPAGAEPRVVATIRPLQLIAAEIMHGAGEPELLIRGPSDAHHHALRPSERRLLATADLVLWVGPVLEGFLTRLVEELQGDNLAAVSLPGIGLRQQDGGVDPHLWLSSENARVIARALADYLAQAHADEAERYRANLAAFEGDLAEADSRIEEILGEVSAHKPYAVYHDAVGYFEERHGLVPLLSVTRDEELRPGLRHLLAVRERLRAAGAACMLVQPGVDTAALANVVDLAEMRYISVDVLGIDIAPRPGAYGRLLEQVALALRDCLHASP